MSHDLTAEERETVISWSDAEATLSIYTAQKPMMERLQRHPMARQIGEHRLIGRIVAMEFELPATCLVILKRPRKLIWSGLVQVGRRGKGSGRVPSPSGLQIRLSRKSGTESDLSGGGSRP